MPQLPMPLCMQSLPTIFPPVMVPAVHLLLALLDAGPILGGVMLDAGARLSESLADIALMPWMLLEWFYLAQVGNQQRWVDAGWVNEWTYGSVHHGEATT
eukprot:Skav226009  [mRNA]  locus=scaffold1010:170385:171703:- [translate_table: standard]